MNRGSRFAAAIAVPVVLGAALLATAPPPYLVDVTAASIEDAEPADTFITKSPAVAPFYDVDAASLPDGEPGDLIKAETVQGGPDGVKTYRIMYHSTDLQGNDIPVTGLYVVPDKPPPPSGWPLVSYTHGTTGIGRACGMSQSPFEPNTPGYSHFARFLKPTAEQGWAVVATDYSGMGAPGPNSYLVGPLEARGALDAIRAVAVQDPTTGSTPIDTNKVGVYGSSQGGSAALSTLELAPEYAPELDIKGGIAMALGVVAPIPGAINLIASNPTSTAQNMFLLLIVKSYADSYPDLVNLDNVLTEEGKKRLPLLDQYCGDDLSKRVEDIPLADMLQQPLDPGIVKALAMSMPGGTPFTQPAVITQGLEDVTIVPQFSHAQVMNSCAWGDQVYYATYPDDTHYTVVLTSRTASPHVFQWMNDRFAGIPAPTNCANESR
ncbi:MAG: lipase family protein [Candidatus Nanopelagicales bacterium]